MRKVYLVPLLALLVPVTVVHGSNVTFPDDETAVPVLIGYANLASRSRLQERLQTAFFRESPALRLAQAVAVKLNHSQVQELEEKEMEGIRYIEEDSLVWPLGEIVPYGIPAIQADRTSPPADGSRPSACNNPNSFKIAIIDSGLQADHPDIPCSSLGDSSTNCIGASFGVGLSDVWHRPSNSHGKKAFNSAFIF